MTRMTGWLKRNPKTRPQTTSELDCPSPAAEPEAARERPEVVAVALAAAVVEDLALAGLPVEVVPLVGGPAAADALAQEANVVRQRQGVYSAESVRQKDETQRCSSAGDRTSKGKAQLI